MWFLQPTAAVGTRTQQTRIDYYSEEDKQSDWDGPPACNSTLHSRILEIHCKPNEHTGPRLICFTQASYSFPLMPDLCFYIPPEIRLHVAGLNRVASSDLFVQALQQPEIWMCGKQSRAPLLHCWLRWRSYVNNASGHY